MEISVFLGAPGSGKGTQAKRLQESDQYVHFSTGDMLRAAIRKGDQVGLRAKGFIDRGELVADSVMIELIEDALSKLGTDAKVILDGFPRTVAQAEALDKSPMTRVKKALFFELDEGALIQRLTGRRICGSCGESFHVAFMPPKKAGICDRCSGALIQREDDKEDVVRRRLQIFTEQNAQLLDYFTRSKRLDRVDASQPVQQLRTELLSHLR